MLLSYNFLCLKQLHSKHLINTFLKDEQQCLNEKPFNRNAIKSYIVSEGKDL